MASVDDAIIISASNTTTTPLTSNASFTGLFENIRQYTEIDFTISGSANSVATGTVYFEFSSDGSFVDVSIPLAISDINVGLVPIPLRVILPFFRMRYVNGSVSQTSFRLTTIYHTKPAIRLTRFPNQTATSVEPLEVSSAILKAQNASGSYSNIILDASGNVPVSAVSLPLPANAVQETGGNLASIKSDLDRLTFAATRLLVDGSGVTQPISGTVSLSSVPTHPVTQSGNWDIIPDRPSQKTGRVYKQGIADQITSSTTIYTVTNGKTLYITNLSFSGYNTNAASAGHIQIRDSTTVLVPISVPSAGVGALASFIPVSISQITFPEPKQFSTNVNINMVTGTNTLSCEFTGYEE